VSDRQPGIDAATPPRVDPESVRATLKAAGLRARHGLSQNFLVDVDVLDDILAAAGPAPGHRVLEIGPGLGILTEALLDAGVTVTAVEIDRGLVRRLREHLAGAIAEGRLRLVEGDVLDVDLAAHLVPPYGVVANLPYHVTSPVLHLLLGGDVHRPERLVLMVQREVAERVAAPPGEMSYLSAFCQYHARARIARLVPPEAFEPAPEVWSAILVLEPYRDGDADAPPRLRPTKEAELWRLVQAAFRERRKMLHNVLRRQLPVPPERVDDALKAAGIAPDRRPQTVSVAEWVALLEAIGPLGPDERGRAARRDDR
jgi:16S rRNA (adenine1518-N6/adenine1519-N6)-dimethyltransferase